MDRSTRRGIAWLIFWIVVLIPSAIYAVRYTPPHPVYNYQCSGILMCIGTPFYNATNKQIETPYTVIKPSGFCSENQQLNCAEGTNLTPAGQIQINQQSHNDFTIYVIVTAVAIFSAFMIFLTPIVLRSCND